MLSMKESAERFGRSCPTIPRTRPTSDRRTGVDHQKVRSLTSRPYSLLVADSLLNASREVKPPANTTIKPQRLNGSPEKQDSLQHSRARVCGTLAIRGRCGARRLGREAVVVAQHMSPQRVVRTPRPSEGNCLSEQSRSLLHRSLIRSGDGRLRRLVGRGARPIRLRRWGSC